MDAGVVVAPVAITDRFAADFGACSLGQSQCVNGHDAAFFC